MTRRRILSAFLSGALLMTLSSRAIADAKLDTINTLFSNTLFSSLNSADVDRAVQTFSPSLKAQLSGDQLVESWNRSYGSEGRLVSWKIIGRNKTRGLNPGTASADSDIELFTVELKFAKSYALVLVGLSPDGQVSGTLWFQAPQSTGVTETAPYVDRSKFHPTDITLPGPRGPLPGTLTIPDGKGPFPAAIIVPGSGSIDRDESSLANRPFKDLAEGLSTRGIVVLRYDKRTFAAPKTLDLMSVTVDSEVIEDAVAAVTTLRARPEVRTDRIFVVGHSLGAVLAPEIAKRAAPVAGIVLLAPAARKLPQIIVDAARFLGSHRPTKSLKSNGKPTS